MITLLIVLILVGFLVWAVGLLPIDATFKQLIRGLAILIAVLYVIAVVTGVSVPGVQLR